MKKTLFIKSLIFICILFYVNHSIGQNKLIQNGDSWNYYDNGYLDKDWMKSPKNYKWKNGITPIGYGDEKVVTEIKFGDDPNNKDVLKYFKKEIKITGNTFLAYEFRTQSDDGIVVYINGKELYRINMPNSSINNSTFASSTIEKEEEHEFKKNIFENSIFKDGINIITASVHQAYADSSDCIFSLELIGHTSPEILTLVIDKKDKKNKDLENELKELNQKFDFNRVSTKNEVLSNSNYILKISLFIIAILFFLLLIAIYYIIENSKINIKKHSDKILVLKENALEKEKEMIFLSSKLLNNKQYFKEIKADLKGIKTEDKSTVRSIISEIDDNLDNQEDWETLKKHFHAVYEGFYDRLLKLHPLLSETDLRHCMFIKLHLQTKEIARVLLIDPRSVQTTRYRIKKKMNLDEDTDLREYLLSV